MKTLLRQNVMIAYCRDYIYRNEEHTSKVRHFYTFGIETV